MNDAPQIDGWLHAIGAALWHELQRLGHGVAIAWHAVTGWPWTPLFVFVVIVVTILGSISYAHRRWKKGWLSGLIDERLSAIRKQRSTTRKRRLRWTDRRLLASELRLTVLETWDKLLDYSKLRFGEQYRDLRFPSPLSFAIIAIIVAAFFFLPRPPQLTAIVHWRLRDWWQLLTADLAGDSARTEGLITGAFTGLAVVVIALIVFVAESIRDNKDPERKKVLVRISYLWPLGVAVDQRRQLPNHQ